MIVHATVAVTSSEWVAYSSGDERLVKVPDGHKNTKSTGGMRRSR